MLLDQLFGEWDLLLRTFGEQRSFGHRAKSGKLYREPCHHNQAFLHIFWHHPWCTAVVPVHPPAFHDSILSLGLSLIFQLVCPELDVESQALTFGRDLATSPHLAQTCWPLNPLVKGSHFYLGIPAVSHYHLWFDLVSQWLETKKMCENLSSLSRIDRVTYHILGVPWLLK